MSKNKQINMTLASPAPDQDQKTNQNDIPIDKKPLDKSAGIIIAMVIIMFISGGLYGLSELLGYIESPPDIIKIDYPSLNNNQTVLNQNITNTSCEDSDIKSFSDDKYIKSDIIVSDAGGQTVKHDKCVDANQLEEMQCIHKPNGEIMSQSIFYNCSYGCLDGACVRTDPQQNKNTTININAANENNNKNNQIINLPPPDKRECVDSDRNLKPDDIYTFGNIKVISEGEEKYKADDQCTGTNQLMEKECGYDGQGRLNNIGGATYNCPYGCLNGACIRPVSQSGNDDFKAGVQQIKSAFFSSCLDSDSAMGIGDKFSKGQSTATSGAGISTTAYDNCANNVILNEMFCEQNSTTGLYLIKSITVLCDNGCREDKCIESAGSNNNSAQPSTTLQSICIDNDAALEPNDIYTKGLATVSNGLGSYTTGYDRCIGDLTIEEVSCIKNPKNEDEYFLQRTPLPCPNGCRDGACGPRITE